MSIGEKIYKFSTYFLVVFILSVIFFNIDLKNQLWDMGVYIRAINDFNMGLNPYRTDVGALFVYHPIILKSFIFINEYINIKIALLLIYFLATVFFVREYLNYLQINSNINTTPIRGSVILLCSFAYAGIGSVAFFSGNLTLFLHFLVLAFFLMCHRKPRKSNQFLFLSCLVIACILKPYFFLYSILLIYLFGYKKSFIYCILIFIIACSIWSISSVLDHDLYLSFIKALSFQIIEKNDVGYSLYGLAKPNFGYWGALSFHCLVILMAFFSTEKLLRKNGYSFKSDLAIPLTVAVIIFANPRMKEYDFIIAILFLYSFICISFPKLMFKTIALSMLINTLPIIGSIYNEGKLILIPSNSAQIYGVLLLIYFISKFIKTLPRINSELIK
jgi:hypothetical protein